MVLYRSHIIAIATVMLEQMCEGKQNPLKRMGFGMRAKFFKLLLIQTLGEKIGDVPLAPEDAFQSVFECFEEMGIV